MTVKKYHSPVRYFFLVDIWFTQAVTRQDKRGLLKACEAPAKVSGGSRTLVCITGFTFSHFSGKASAEAPDTRDDEAPPEKCKKIYIYVYILIKRILCRLDT